ncbi:hypothetical protein J132_02085 [Termitomyces sp. J132]|nr:hypothetical protein J132_02085 [Termitomyces sp. J132]
MYAYICYSLLVEYLSSIELLPKSSAINRLLVEGCNEVEYQVVVLVLLATMAPATPTRREILLVVVLYFSLRLLTHKSDTSVSNPLTTSTHATSSPSANDSTYHHISHYLDAHLTWGSSPVPQTRVLSHAPGWTVFDKLYVLKGVVYIVSDEPSKVPNVTHMYSKGLFIENGKEAVASRLPTDEDIRVISTKEAKVLFGTGAHLLDGVNVCSVILYYAPSPNVLTFFKYFINDPYQFVTHYYHWSAELWFGLWHTYASLDLKIPDDGKTSLPPVRRIMFNHLDAYHWRDYASMNEWVIRSGFPSLVMEFKDDWRDRAEMGRPFVFDRVILADRSASMLTFNFARFQRSASASFGMPGSAHWWMTMRNNVIQFTGLDISVGSGTTNTPVITYISRQEWGRRMLIKEDHEKLVEELYKLRDRYGFEVNVVAAEKMSRLEQIELAARTTVSSPTCSLLRASYKYNWTDHDGSSRKWFDISHMDEANASTTRALGMIHYGFWGNEYFTSPGLPQPKYVEGFQGNSIPLDGALVARLCLERLSLTGEVDD